MGFLCLEDCGAGERERNIGSLSFCYNQHQTSFFASFLKKYKKKLFPWGVTLGASVCQVVGNLLSMACPHVFSKKIVPGVERPRLNSSTNTPRKSSNFTENHVKKRYFAVFCPFSSKKLKIKFQ